ncbi:hypothetical protein GE21DRAFT_8473 [Neurospora crassa]|uniref:Uncharacterized protein n=2 Tax=Neurospora crassa TaxID=5141 RepID=Q1K5U1_NEUCR|nr:hypothetical protein NCU07207 [Neurospora crassa OR74A]EAA28196.1 hypothetical protein NCU07207 [Neurospora crassa OR74A]KHE85761.1 hypothetical protein GE21DRAFT_8473 [Neurospora crassa]CAD71075.1 hypothetical protein [Neurospora crassa]|eukprot:XP_957432.1 hypothetical protein NCU07207 [Neurospora crassa OR74A]
MSMSKVMSNDRAAEKLSHILLNYHSGKGWEKELADVLQAFAVKYHELSPEVLLGTTGFDNSDDHPSTLWHKFFVKSLQNTLKELPPNVDKLKEAVDALEHQEEGKGSLVQVLTITILSRLRASGIEQSSMLFSFRPLQTTSLEGIRLAAISLLVNMSQPPQSRVFTREQAIESLAEFLIKDKLSTDPRWKGELSDALQDFAARYCELSLKGWDGRLDLDMRLHKDAPSQYWHVYFVESLRKMLKYSPASTEDLMKTVRELIDANRKAFEGRGNPASPATLRAFLRAGFDVNNNDDNNKRPAATEDDDLNTPNRSKGAKTEAGATNFTVHARGPYTVRVFEGDIPLGEFSSSTPATVQVRLIQKSAASAAAVDDCDESDN